MPQLRSALAHLAPADARSPFSMPSFRARYRIMRRLLALSVIGFTLAVGIAWADGVEVVVPGLIGLAVAVLAHGWILPDVSWRSMAMFDSVAYTGMLIIIELAEPIAFVVMSHVLIGFLTTPPRIALKMTAALMGLGWLGYATIDQLNAQIYEPGERLFLSVVVSIMAMVPSCLAMLMAGAEMRAKRDKVEELLNEKDALLAEKSRFLAMVSHEMKTPLTVVHGLASLLESADLEEAERSELIRTVARESGDVAAIVDDLLVVARLDHGKLSMQPQPIELDSLIRQVGHSTGILPAITPGGTTTALADPLRVKQVMRNLVTNAQRHGGTGIRIEISADSDEVTVSVCDDGPGVPPGREDVIFEPYSQTQERRHAESVGLGLSVSRELARMMGGDLVYSRSGEWTRFALTLPAGTPAEDS